MKMLSYFGLSLLTCLACLAFVIFACIFCTLLSEFVHKIVSKFCNDKESEKS